jgi:hypothetical protein
MKLIIFLTVFAIQRWSAWAEMLAFWTLLKGDNVFLTLNRNVLYFINHIELNIPSRIAINT